MKRKPIVAIVGRPNVGKSTLFNRIIRKREAIVDDAPGITRDRKMAQTDWEGVPFLLMDTGGYTPGSQDIIEAGISRQVKLAIDEADVIIFLVDCTTGITDVDDTVAELLRKSDKPYILAVNKVEGEAKRLAASEFYRLGLGDPQTISALEGSEIGDLLSLIIEKIDNPQVEVEEPEDEAIRLAIVGKPNVGKSTFVNTILGEERLLVTDIPGTTRDAVDVRINFNKRELVLIDTAGLRRRTKVKESVEFYSNIRTHRVVEECDVACVFVDASEGVTQQDQRLIKAVVDQRKGIALIVNKWDLMKGNPELNQEFRDDLAMKLQGLDFVPVLFVSCHTKQRIHQVLELAVRIAEERDKRIPSSPLNQLIEEINRQYQPPAIGGKRVRIYYATQVKTKPPLFTVFTNFPEHVKDEYKRFFEKRIRAAFGFEGVPISLLFRKR